MASDVKISKGKFVFNSYPYFRGAAQNVELGSWGEKKSPIGGTNYLFTEGKIAPTHLAKINVIEKGPWPVEWSKHSSNRVNASISYITDAGGTASFSKTRAERANLKLVLFRISPSTMIRLLNERAKTVRDSMKKEGAAARVVGEIFVAMEGKIASAVKKCGKVAGRASNGGILVKLAGTSCGVTTSSVEL
ncbi:MAG: hypothetical protein AAGA56_09840, partial [Myxococcota bacterium]